MKKTAFLLILFFLVVNLYSQTETDKKNTIGVHVAPGTFTGAGVWIKTTYGVGVNYSRRLSDSWSFYSGLESHAFFHKGSGSKSTITFIGEDGQEIERTLINKSRLDWTITTIPVQFKHHGKRVDFKFGPLVNIYDLFYDNWTTSSILGWEYGVGFDREFNNGITLYLNPYIRFNGVLLPLYLGNNDYSSIQSGVNFGVGYKF